MKPTKSRQIWWLIAGISGICATAATIHTYTPDQFVAVIAFFLLVFVSFYFLMLFLFNTPRRAILVSAGLVIFLILRMLGLREPIYALLLAAALISLELVLQTR